MDDESEESYIIRNVYPQAIEFKVRDTAVSVGFSSNFVSSLSPLRLSPVNIHEEALLKTIRDQAKKIRPSRYLSPIQSIRRSDPPACTKRDPPACTNHLSEDTFKEKMTVTTEELDMEPVTKTIEDKLVEANAKLDAVQIMLEISKLEAEAEAMAKAAGVAIQKAKQALKEANEEANNTQQGAGGNNKELKNLNRAITDCIEKTIQNAESQVINETIDERADSVQETSADNEEQREGISIIDVGATTDKDFDCSSAPLLNDKEEFESLTVPAPELSVHQIDTKEEILTIIDLAEPPSIIRQSSIPSPTTDEDIICAPSAPLLNDEEYESLPVPVPDPPDNELDSPIHEIDMKEDVPFIIDLVDPPSIIRQGAVPSPTPDEDVICADPSSFYTPPKNHEVVESKDEPSNPTEVVASSTLESCDLEEQNSSVESFDRKIEGKKTAEEENSKTEPEHYAAAVEESKRCDLAEVVARSTFESCDLKEQNPPLGSSDKKIEIGKTAKAKYIKPNPEQHVAAEEYKRCELTEVVASSTFESCDLEKQDPPLGSLFDKLIEIGNTTKPKYTTVPEQHEATEESKHCDLTGKDTKDEAGEVRVSNTNSVDGILEVLYAKIEECRKKLMDPRSSMEDQGAAAQLMTKYAVSAQALKKTKLS